MIGKRLKLARSAAGLSLRRLEERIGNLVTAQAIGKYERDESMPGSDVLVALASALGVSVDYMIGDPKIVLETIEFRKKRITNKREEAQVEAKVLHLLERYLTIEEALGMQSIEWHKPRAVPYPVTQDMSEAELAAMNLRREWSLGMDPIPNLAELLEEKGIKVFSLSLTNIDGLTARVRRAEQDGIPVIVVNCEDWGERQRFTLAHELGHMVMDVSSRVSKEKAAHRFAGAFLIPRDTLWAEVGKHRTSIRSDELLFLKQIFGVSVQAITYRCKDLGIFNRNLFKRLFDEFDRLGWRNPPYKEPNVLPGENPVRFKRLTLRALAEGAISESKAAELLEISVYDLDNYTGVGINSPGQLRSSEGLS